MIVDDALVGARGPSTWGGSLLGPRSRHGPPILVIVESVENPVGSGCQLADDASSLRQRLQAGVNDSEIGSSGFGVGDFAVPVQIEGLKGGGPLSSIITGLLVRGGMRSW